MDKLGNKDFRGWIKLKEKLHNGSWYVPFEFQNKIEIAAVHQMRNMDVSRLYDRIGRVPDSDLKLVKGRVVELLSAIDE